MEQKCYLYKILVINMNLNMKVSAIKAGPAGRDDRFRTEMIFFRKSCNFCDVKPMFMRSYYEASCETHGRKAECYGI